MDRITKHDLERRLDLLNRYIGEDAYGLSWADGGVRIYEAGEGEDVGPRGTKREIYNVLAGMCHVASCQAAPKQVKQRDHEIKLLKAEIERLRGVEQTLRSVTTKIERLKEARCGVIRGELHFDER